MCVRSYYLLFTEIVIEWIVVRPVHGLGQFSFGPNPDLTFRHRVEGGRTRNRPPVSIGRVSFGFECGRFQFMVIGNYICRWKLQNFCPNLQILAKNLCSLAGSG